MFVAGFCRRFHRGSGKVLSKVEYLFSFFSLNLGSGVIVLGVLCCSLGALGFGCFRAWMLQEFGAVGCR